MMTRQHLSRASGKCKGTQSTCLQVRALGKMGRSPEDEIARLRDAGANHAAAAWLSLAQQESALELQRQYHETVSWPSAVLQEIADISMLQMVDKDGSRSSQSSRLAAAAEGYLCLEHGSHRHSLNCSAT